MPGALHEGLRYLLGSRPELVRALVRGLGVAVPEGPVVEAMSTFSDLAPPTYAADLVLRVGDASSLIVEVQTAIDDDKPFAWPRYCASEHALRRGPVWVVVLATSRRVARWARRPVATFQPGSRFAPLVIGPDEIARRVEHEGIHGEPELAVLLAVLHAQRRDATELAVAAIEAARGLDREPRRLYMDLVIGSLGAVARAAVEAIMRDRGYEPLTEIGREMLRKGRVEGRVEGLRAAVEEDCRALGIGWTDERAAAVAAMDAAALQALHGALLRERAWPTH